MKLAELEGKKILIVGMGSEGKATYAFLKQKLKNAQLDSADKKDGADYLAKQPSYDLAIKSPGVPLTEISIPFTTSANIFFANFKGYTIGITGTKGKSTTTKLTYDILKAAHKSVALAGNIGIPLLEVLNDFTDPDGVAVCELSSYQLEGFEHTPNIALITNIYDAHLEHHGSRQQYVAAKANILGQATPATNYIYNPDFDELRDLAEHTQAKAIPFEAEPLAQPSQLPGKFNADNIRAAQTIASVLDVPKPTIIKAINDFKPLPHRLELLGTFRGIRFYDDATSTTPESTIAALETLNPVETLLLGGQDIGYDFVGLADAVGKNGVKNLVLFPDSGPKIKKLLSNDLQLNLLETSSMEAAIKFAYQHASAGGICLLSTAAPSFTVWKDYLDKANQFKQFVTQLGSQ